MSHQAPNKDPIDLDSPREFTMLLSFRGTFGQLQHHLLICQGQEPEDSDST